MAIKQSLDGDTIEHDGLWDEAKKKVEVDMISNTSSLKMVI